MVTRKSIFITIFASLLPLLSQAQKAKADIKSAEIVAENTAAALGEERLRSVQIDTVRSHKQKVAEALVAIDLYKESLKKAQRDTRFFNLESGYYKAIIKTAGDIIATIPKFVKTATTCSPQATVKAIKVGTEISAEVAAIISTYKKICVNSSDESDMPTNNDDGNQSGSTTGNVDTGGNTGGNTGGGTGTTPATPDTPENPGGGSEEKPKPPFNPTLPDDFGELTHGDHKDPDAPGNDQGGSSGTNDDGSYERPSNGGGSGLPDVPKISLIRKKAGGATPETNTADSTAVHTGGDDFGRPGSQVEHEELPQPKGGDGFNWLSRSERLSVAINLHTRLATIKYKMKIFINSAPYYKPKDIIRMIDPHTWIIYTGSRYIVDDIIWKLDKFNFNIK